MKIIQLENIFWLLVALVVSSEAYKILELPDINVEKWMGSSLLEESGELEWDTDFEYLPREALKIVDSGSTFIVSQHLSGLEIICNASYPVEWIFEQAEYAGDDTYNIVFKYTRESSDVHNPKNDRFLARLELFGDSATNTGNYICKSVQDLGLQKSIFVYWEGSSPPFLVLSGKTVHVQSEDNHTVVLPCYVSQPDVDVQLLKEDSGKFQPLAIGVKFDTKIGFLLDFRKMGNINPYGRYKCVSAEEEDDNVNIIVETGLRPKRQFANLMSPGTGLFYDADRQEIVCCARSGGRPPTLHNIFCPNPSMCHMREYKLYKSGNRQKLKINGSCSSDKVFSRDYGLLRCKGDGIDVFRPIYTDFSKIRNQPQDVYFSWKDIVPENMMILVIHNEPPYFHQQTVTISCEGMNSYFADGHKWEIRWRNKTTTPFNPIEYIDDPHIHGLRNMEMKLHWKMLELVCYIPVWNTTGWVSKTVKLDVHKSTTPVIEGLPVEEINMVLNDTEKLLECKSYANPSATVEWKKNNEDIPKNMIIWKENGTSILLFHRVSHDTQADYKCIAKNYAGEAQKIIHVFVEVDSGSSAWGTTATWLVPILIIAFIATAGFLVWKMQIQKKIVDHLSRIVFRDTERQSEYT